VSAKSLCTCRKCVGVWCRSHSECAVLTVAVSDGSHPHERVTAVTYATWSVLCVALPNFSTVQHLPCRVAMELFAHRVTSDKPRQLPSESFSNVYVQFSVHIIFAVKLAYISLCESAHVFSCMQFFYIRWSSLECSNYINGEVYRISCIQCIHKHRLALTVRIVPHKLAVSHFSALHEVWRDACMKSYSQNCIIRFDNCRKLEALPAHWLPSLCSLAWTSGWRVSDLQDFQYTNRIILKTSPFLSPSLLPYICRCLVKWTNLSVTHIVCS
jgi:hypothetical protein